MCVCVMCVCVMCVCDVCVCNVCVMCVCVCDIHVCSASGTIVVWNRPLLYLVGDVELVRGTVDFSLR